MINLPVSRREIIWIGIASLVILAACLTPGMIAGNSGFPLDDAWIHQTYARNLANNQQWSYFSGNNTNGSTAPLWTFLLALGYFLKIPYLVWAYFWGGFFLFGTGVAGLVLLRELFPRHDRLTLISAILLVGEWHLGWASVSGMETILLAFGIIVLFWLSLGKQKNWLGIGTLIGLMVWIRPDAITLLGPVGLILCLEGETTKEKIIHGLTLGGGILLLFIPYMAFNKTFSGSWMPNTFYAKQAEYAELLNLNWFVRLGVTVFQPLIGGGSLLLPGVVFIIWKMTAKRFWKGLAWAIWWSGYTCIYATLLPVAYQHGRYLMPAMPVFWVLGLWGTIELITRYWRKKNWAIAVKAWGFSILAIWLGFLVMGVRAYSEDVSIIQSEMVTTSQWISTHTTPDAVIAAHDIGALGYFGQRKLIDLAGLVTPEIIPIIRNEKELGKYLDQHGADYLMTFPDWYVDLPKGKGQVFQTSGGSDSQINANHMTLYLWRDKK